MAIKACKGMGGALAGSSAFFPGTEQAPGLAHVGLQGAKTKAKAALGINNELAAFALSPTRFGVIAE